MKMFSNVCFSTPNICICILCVSTFLGFTNFDLLGDFGQIEWLGNFRIVLIYNLVFMIATILCLVTKVTASVRREMYRRLDLFETFEFRENLPTKLNYCFMRPVSDSGIFVFGLYTKLISETRLKFL